MGFERPRDVVLDSVDWTVDVNQIENQTLYSIIIIIFFGFVLE